MFRCIGGDPDAYFERGRDYMLCVGCGAHWKCDVGAEPVEGSAAPERAVLPFVGCYPDSDRRRLSPKEYEKALSDLVPSSTGGPSYSPQRRLLAHYDAVVQESGASAIASPADRGAPSGPETEQQAAFREQRHRLCEMTRSIEGHALLLQDFPGSQSRKRYEQRIVSDARKIIAEFEEDAS